ncbi:MAG: arsenate reductase (glutaredoxin) [Rhodospirillales bacterium]|jgi:arsenate reductase (glutaredoxin)|nr:arsenate reductase (glutaredoxin) [Rhodospirillales bacterium]
MSVTIYHNPRCSKSRQTLAILEEKNVDYRVVEYLLKPPGKAELKRILGLLGLKAHDIVRKKEAREAGLEIAEMSEAALIDAMVKAPVIIERPIVVAGDKAVMGRPPENVLSII